MTKVRQLQKEATRKKIVKAAYKIYGEQGFSTSTQVIAKEAEVSHGTIFVHFPTREALLSFLMEDFFGQMGDLLHQLVKDGCSIEELLLAHLELLQDNEAFYASLTAQLTELPQKTVEEVIAFQSILSFHFSQSMEKEQKKGRIKEVPLHMLFHTWIGLVHYYLQNKTLFTPDGSVLAQRGDELIRTYLQLIQQ